MARLLRCCKTRQFCVVCVVCVFLIVYLLGYDLIQFTLHSNVSEQRLSKVNKQNLGRLKFYSGASQTPKRIPFRWTEIKPTYELLNELRTKSVDATEIREKCSLLPITEKIGSPRCRAEWMYSLEVGHIVAIENMMGFISGKLAGFEILLEDGRKAMYKPCAGPAEYPENEVRASHLDYALGFNRAPVSVTRNFTVDYFRKIAREQTKDMLAPALDHKMIILEQIEASCSDHGILYGTMIGWIDGLKGTKTFPKRLKDTSYHEIANFRVKNEPNYVADVFQNHFMFYLIGEIRSSGKNEYSLSTGELMTVDLDRVRWKLSGGMSPKDLSLCYFCKMKQKTLEQIQEASEDITLATTIRHSLLYDLGQFTLTMDELRIIQERLQLFFMQCFEPCIKTYATSDVIIP